MKTPAVCHAGAGIFLLWSGFMVGCVEPNTTIYDLPADVAIPIVFESWQSSLNAGQVPEAMKWALDDYLHMGHDRSELELWITSLGGFQSPEVLISPITIDQDGDQVVVGYSLWIQSCDRTFDWLKPEPPQCQTVLRCKSSHPGCGWLRNMRRVDHIWRFSGDQASWGHDFTLSAKEGAVHLTGLVYDPLRAFSRVVASWVGMESDAGGTWELERATGNYWSLPGDGRLPQGLYPDHPLPWELALQLEDASGATEYIWRFSSVMDEFASALQPNGEILPPFEFSWLTPSKGEGGVQVEVLANAQVFWRSPLSFQDSLAYAGPTMEALNSYEYLVRAYDTSGNCSASKGSFITLSEKLISPEPSSVSPQTGSKNGGEQITIAGQGFLPGARVLFDITDCLDVTVKTGTQIECTSPALEPGIYNILVINPAGRVGLIARGFQVLGT